MDTAGGTPADCTRFPGAPSAEAPTVEALATWPVGRGAANGGDRRAPDDRARRPHWSRSQLRSWRSSRLRFARWCMTIYAVARRWGRSALLIRMTRKFALSQL